MAKERKDDSARAEVQKWLGIIKSYEKEFSPWEKRAVKVVKRYRDEKTLQNRDNPPSSFNILWSNVQTLIPATFARLPKPDVSRRFSDRDPVGRVAAMILERGLEFEIQHYGDYGTTLKQAVLDRFLGGRGSAWARYEPHVRAAGLQTPVDGEQVSEDSDEPQEELEYECAPVDYVHWRDFGHTVARTWEEVTAVWRKVYMTREALVERFGEKGEKIPLDATPEELKRAERENPELAEQKRACIVEIWSKTDKEALWLSSSMKEAVLDRRDAEALAQKGLEFEGFFPCPRPLYATLTNDSLVPVPDYALYQDQAEELNVLTDRIDGLVKALQVKGVYDASLGPEIARLFTDSDNTDLRPVKNWQSFAEKNGLKGAIDIVDLGPIAGALDVAYQAMAQAKEQIYDITGISDIVRGQSKASETATAQQIKGQYAGLRLRDMQQGVAIFATDLLKLKAQIVSGFDEQTLMAIAAVDQLAVPDQQYVPQAIQLLKDRPLRNFRVEIAADSLVQIDEQEEKENRVEFLTAVGTFLEKSAQVATIAPAIVPLLGELLKFGVTGFKVGRSVEGVIDQALENYKQSAQAGPPPDPKLLEEQAQVRAKAEVAQQNATKEIGLNKRAADLDIREMKFGIEQELKKQQDELRGKLEQQNTDHAERELQMSTRESELSAKAASGEQEIAEKKAGLEREYLDKSQSAAELKEQTLQQLGEKTDQLAQGLTALAQRVEQVAKLAAAKKRIVRGPDGRAVGLEVVQ